MTVVRPTRGHVFFLPDLDDPQCADDSVLVRADHYTPPATTGTIIAIGDPVEQKKQVRGKWITIKEPCECSLYDYIQFPIKKSREDMGHEIQIGDQMIRIFSFEQIKNCVVLEEQEA